MGSVSLTLRSSLFSPGIHWCIVPWQIHASRLLRALLKYQGGSWKLGISSGKLCHWGGSQSQYSQAAGTSGPGDQRAPSPHPATQSWDLQEASFQSAHPKKKKQENPRENPSPTHRFDPKHQRCTKSEKSHFQIPTAHGFKGNKSAFPYINQEVQQPREAHLSQRNLLWKKPWDSQLFWLRNKSLGGRWPILLCYRAPEEGKTKLR